MSAWQCQPSKDPVASLLALHHYEQALSWLFRLYLYIKSTVSYAHHHPQRAPAPLAQPLHWPPGRLLYKKLQTCSAAAAHTSTPGALISTLVKRGVRHCSACSCPSGQPSVCPGASIHLIHAPCYVCPRHLATPSHITQTATYPTFAKSTAAVYRIGTGVGMPSSISTALTCNRCKVQGVPK